MAVSESAPEVSMQDVLTLYRQARMWSDIEVPRIEAMLTMQAYDPEPTRALVAKHEALDYPYACDFGDARLTIDRGVFCPTLTNVSPFVLDHLKYLPFSGKRVLDAFTGSGAFAVNAALRGAEVVAFDNSPTAVGCAEDNAVRNSVGNTVDVRLGTLEETVATDETFDYVIANPPLIPGDPQQPLESALFDESLQATRSLIGRLPNLLAKTGVCFLATSDVIDRIDYKVDISRLCRDARLDEQITAKRHLPYESYRIHELRHATIATRLRPLAKRMLAYLI